MKIALISDVHAQWYNLIIPECDLLISAGDYSYRGELPVVKAFHKWLSMQPAKHVISLQGNHELWVEKNWGRARDTVRYIDSRIHFVWEKTITIEGKKIHCSSVTPEFNNWAYNRKHGDEIRTHWDRIPFDTEILVTHGPPYGILDMTSDFRNVGCKDLEIKVQELHQLKLHVFGHIHDSSGEHCKFNKLFINASICDENYRATNPVRIVDLSN